MIRLNFQTVPAWLDLGRGVRVECLPMTSAIYQSAHRDPMMTALPDDADPVVHLVCLVKAVAIRAIIGWEGVGDIEGEAIAPSPEAVCALMDTIFFDVFNQLYFAPWWLLAGEKKS